MCSFSATAMSPASREDSRSPPRELFPSPQRHRPRLHVAEPLHDEIRLLPPFATRSPAVGVTTSRSGTHAAGSGTAGTRARTCPASPRAALATDRRRRHVLQRALLPRRVRRAEVERPEVHRLVGAVVLHVPRQTPRKLCPARPRRARRARSSLDERRSGTTASPATGLHVEPTIARPVSWTTCRAVHRPCDRRRGALRACLASQRQHCGERDEGRVRIDMAASFQMVWSSDSTGSSGHVQTGTAPRPSPFAARPHILTRSSANIVRPHGSEAPSLMLDLLARLFASVAGLAAVVFGLHSAAPEPSRRRLPTGSRRSSSLPASPPRSSPKRRRSPTRRTSTSIRADASGCSSFNYRKFKPKPLRAEGDRILILEDTDGDGVGDKTTVFYQGPDIDSAMGICVLGNKVIVSAYTKIFVFTDDERRRQARQEGSAVHRERSGGARPLDARLRLRPRRQALLQLRQQRRSSIMDKDGQRRSSTGRAIASTPSASRIRKGWCSAASPTARSSRRSATTSATTTSSPSTPSARSGRATTTTTATAACASTT